ncbi:MAG: hypothetical protein HC819_16335 [Cyclobacteriaceae bacterium]|nr:hypothetical protein [Cyclobacteriaceae bacterium]
MAQYKTDAVISALEEVNSTSFPLSVYNPLVLQTAGGHLQGVQSMMYQQEKYYFLSGSSDAYSYYTIIKGGEKNIMISINKILETPFSHAGGFQISDDLLAIGVEDDKAKNKSKVLIFHIENPEKPPREPVAIIDRIGTYQRGTAGCVAITTVEDKTLVVVGDWDTEHPDFYRIDREKLFERGASLELEFTIDSKKLNKKHWVDQEWHSYQNINFVRGKNNTLYLAGMGIRPHGDNVIDLYQIQSESLSSFALNKIYTRTFAANGPASFRWGSGMSIDENGNISLMTTEENIGENTIIEVYQ